MKTRGTKGPLSVVGADERWLDQVRAELLGWGRSHAEPYAESLKRLICDPRNLKLAWQRVSGNAGRNTPGVDGFTSEHIESRLGVSRFLTELGEGLSKGTYRPSPTLRKKIPKEGKPGESRNLGIPTIVDRVAQSAILQVVEPLFEARFLETSVGFRKGRGVGDAVRLLCSALAPGSGFRYAIECDIRGCFDHISHAAILRRFRARLADSEVIGWIQGFLQTGTIDGDTLIPTTSGVPQGGLISPLLSNIALGAMDEYYRDQSPDFYCVRYADDSVILCRGDQSAAEREKQRLSLLLKRELGLELSQEKTKISRVHQPGDRFVFVGYEIAVGRNRKPAVRIPSYKDILFRGEIVELFEKSRTRHSLERVLARLNPRLRGWGNFYGACENAPEVFSRIDQLVFGTTLRWLKRKHRGLHEHEIYWHYGHDGYEDNSPGWADGDEKCVRLEELIRAPELDRKVIPLRPGVAGDRIERQAKRVEVPVLKKQEDNGPVRPEAGEKRPIARIQELRDHVGKVISRYLKAA